MTQELPEILKPLWTGESVICICGHHVYCHNTWNDGSITCNYHSDGKSCNCNQFIACNVEGELLK